MLGLGKTRWELEKIPVNWDEMNHEEKGCWVPGYYRLHDEKTGETEYAPYIPEDTFETIMKYDRDFDQ